MLQWETNKSGNLGDCNISFFFPWPSMGCFFTERSVWGVCCAFFLFWLYHFLSVCRFSRVGSVVLKVFRYHWDNWNLVETALHFYVEFGTHN